MHPSLAAEPAGEALLNRWCSQVQREPSDGEVGPEGMDVPAVLLEGHHKKIEEWQHEEKMAMTKKWRPDLIK